MTYRTEDAYGQGYVDGKAKAYFELRHHVGAGHAASCGCEPCITVRAILAGVADSADILDVLGYAGRDDVQVRYDSDACGCVSRHGRHLPGCVNAL